MLSLMSKKMHKNGAKYFLALLLMFGMTSFAPQAKAGAWGESIFAMLTDNVLDSITRQIEGAILGTLKVTAIQMLNNQLSQLVGGQTSGQALFITRWDDFLYDTPQRKTNLMMNDFFTLSTRGKFASANYIGAGDLTGDVSENYTGYLVNQAQRSIGTEGSAPTYNLDQYAASPDALFAEGDWRGFNAYFSNPANNTFGYSLMAENAYAESLAREEEIAQVKAQSSGFIVPESNGVTIAPAALIEAKASSIQSLGDQMIASASNPAEFLSGVVSAVVNTTINKLVQNGVGQIQSNIQREVNGASYQIGGALSQATSSLGPAANFSSVLNQRTNVSVNVKTPPPPSPLAY